MGEGSHGIEFLQQNDSSIQVSLYENNGGFDRMSILNLAADGVILETFDDLVDFVEKKHSNESFVMQIDLNSVEDLIFLTTELDSYISDRFGGFLKDSVLEVYGISVDYFRDIFKSLGEWIRNGLEEWKERSKQRRLKIANGLGRFWKGTKRLSGKSWNDAKWASKKTWEGTKWIGNKTWKGGKRMANYLSTIHDKTYNSTFGL